MRKLVYGIAVVMTLCIPGLILAWITPVNISNTSEISNFPCMAIGKNGHIHVVWDEWENAWFDDRILYCYWDGYNWFPPVNLSGDSTVCVEPDIAIDTLGYIHVVWRDCSVEEIFWRFYDGSEWSSPVNLSNRPGRDFWPKMKIDRFNRVHAVWVAVGSKVATRIQYSLYDGNSWTPPEAVSDDVEGSYADVAVDSKGNPHVVWMHWKSASIIETYYSKKEDGVWSTPVCISGSCEYTRHPVIAIDSRDYPFVVWSERYRLHYTFWYGRDWTSPVAIQDTVECVLPHIVADAEDNIHMTWGRAKSSTTHDGAIHYAFYNGSFWSDFTRISEDWGTTVNSDIAIDDAGCLHAVWSQRIGPRSDFTMQSTPYWELKQRRIHIVLQNAC